ncbi:MAG: DUF1636 domain-containing protein [Pseudomonadota bacterium]
MTTTLYVCTTCKAGQPVPEGELLPGTRLFDELKRQSPPDGVSIVGVECLSACSAGCTVSLTKPGGWSYVYGRLTLDDVPAILEGAGKYAATNDGVVLWRDRPAVFRKQGIARVPPQFPLSPTSPDEAAE